MSPEAAAGTPELIQAPLAQSSKMQSSKYDTFQHPLAERNASPEMVRIWSPRKKFSGWRRIWVALAKAQRKLGLTRITEEAITQMEANVDNIDFALAEKLETELGHDVMAHIHAFEAVAPAAKGIIQLGATSMDINDNGDLLIMREALDVVISKLVNVIDAIGTFAEKHKNLATLGYTHLQVAQPTTVGKRATLWCYDYLMALETLEDIRKKFKLRGLKGATGTQDSYMKLFDGDHAKVDELERLFLEEIGGEGTECFPVTGQVYPRMADTDVIQALAKVAQAGHKMSNDIRVLSFVEEMEEPVSEKQVGSTAMAYKRNPAKSERLTGLARYAEHLPGIAAQTAAEQFLERTLDDSSTRRMTLPEAFLVCDGILIIETHVSRGMTVYPKIIEKRLREKLPFMATEEILMRAVKAGGDRQELHEAIRLHSRAAIERVKVEGLDNDLVERLKGDARFEKVNIDETLDPNRHIGRAPEQTEAFLRMYVDPVRTRFAHLLGMKAELKV